VLEMRAKARRLKTDENIGMLVVDYLQLMSGGGKGSDSRTQEVSEISRGLKALARELAIPVIALSQLSRGPESRQDKRPMLSDLRESGSIEQDADLVMFLFREEYYLRPEEIEEKGAAGLAELIIAKHRNGPTGMVPLYFHKAYTRFDNLADEGGVPGGGGGGGYEQGNGHYG
jgi:replicative DNA helicase